MGETTQIIMDSFIIFESNVIPFLLMIFASIRISLTILSSRKNLERVSQRRMKKRKSKDNKYAASSITFDVLFIVLKLPLTINFINEFVDNDLGLVTLNSILLVFYINYCIGFFIHMATNSIFRTELSIILRPQCRSSIGSINSQSASGTMVIIVRNVADQR